MTRQEWLSQFEDELVKLRPHLSGTKALYTIALAAYDAKDHPRDKARDYHKRQQPQKPAPPSKRGGSK
jgi:hypothetical protein